MTEYETTLSSKFRNEGDWARKLYTEKQKLAVKTNEIWQAGERSKFHFVTQHFAKGNVGWDIF